MHIIVHVSWDVHTQVTTWLHGICQVWRWISCRLTQPPALTALPLFFSANCPCSPHSNLPILSSSSTLLIEWRIYPLILIPHTKRGWIISFLSHPAWVGPLQKFPCCASHKRTVTHYPSSTSLRVFASSPLPPAVWEQVEEVNATAWRGDRITKKAVILINSE